MARFKKVLVIGLDGLEPTIVDSLLARSGLPHLAALAGRGGYSRLATTLPAQTPVAWSTFATGVNPGGHGIFDFIRRDPRTYLPDFALNRYEQPKGYLPPRAVNLRRGTPVWQVLSDAGVPSVVLRCPCTFPPDTLRGRMLSGMGVPDVRGGLGTSTFFSADPAARQGESEQLVRVTPNGGTVRTTLVGPRHPKSREDVTAQIAIDIDETRRAVTIRSKGRPRALTVEEGRWSDWLHVKFKLGFLQSVPGTVRFYLARVSPHLELYASPVNFDPTATIQYPVASPAGYAGELADRLGTFYTTGMVEDHGGLTNGRFDEAVYLAQCQGVLDERERMLQYELARFEEGLLFCLFDTPDRIQHMFWRFREPDHPANSASGFDPSLRSAIEEHYEACDAIVGRAVEHAADDTLVVCLSDHGFSSFQRGFHINSWLHEQELLALKPGVAPGADAGELLLQVDWSRTRAYALGIGSVYLNVRGRERSGVVEPADARALTEQIAGALANVADPDRATLAVRGATPGHVAYRGAAAADAPDLVVRFAPGYRASWTTALGGIPQGLFEDNEKRWGGDHIIDPALVPGVLFMSHPFDAASIGLVDLAPTILETLGVPVPAQMEGAARIEKG